MFGYVTPVKTELAPQEYILYRAFYCGICVATKPYGQISRYMTNYDIVFLSLFVHDQLNQPVEFKEVKCVGNPFQKKPIVVENPTLKKLVAVNIILGYYKIKDDIIDNKNLKNLLAGKIFQKAYERAKNEMPEADAILDKYYTMLRNGEKNNEKSIDRICHPFSQILCELAKLLVPNIDENGEKMCYNLGKFVYLIDALDDVDEDFKKKRYNPLLVKFNNYSSRQQFIRDNKQQLEWIFASTVNRIIGCFNELKFCQSYSLMKNIVYLGLRQKVKEIFASEKKLDKPKL